MPQRQYSDHSDHGDQTMPQPQPQHSDHSDHGDHGDHADHIDTPHSDVHGDGPHGDAHADTPHIDFSHLDLGPDHLDWAHLDSHHDTQHGDVGDPPIDEVPVFRFARRVEALLGDMESALETREAEGRRARETREAEGRRQLGEALTTLAGQIAELRAEVAALKRERGSDPSGSEG